MMVLICLCFCGGCERTKNIASDNTTGGDASANETKKAGMKTGDLLASMAELPGLAETPDKGAFVDLVKAMDGVYPDGDIIIEIFPFARSVDNVINGKADFHVPTLRNPEISEENLPYRTVTESMGTVVFVLYSHIDNVLTKAAIDKATKAGGEFPYKIEVPGGLGGNFLFTTIPSNDLSSSMQKVANKRIDAVLWAQEESDLTLRELKIKTIRRNHYADFDDAIIIPKGPEGDKTNRILSGALKTLKTSGRQKALYSKIHLPYDDWQPADMKW